MLGKHLAYSLREDGLCERLLEHYKESYQ